MSSELARADKPEDVGLSSDRLQRLTDTLKTDIDKGIVPGAVALIARRGKTAYEIALGYCDREAGTAMEVDTIFRIASMTKPFTSLAAMMLAEEGKLLIVDPVARFIPEFSELKVAAYEAANVGDEKQTNAEMAAKLATVPLAYQPGSTWQYGMSTDVLGRVVEAASGMDLDRFIIERICKPLGLRDSSFGPIAYARAAQPQVDAASGKRPPMRDPTIRSNWISGGSALLSTARDYVHFCQMLLNGGDLGGTRLVSPTTIALMTSDHLTPETRRSPSTPILFGALAPSPELGLGFGLGFAVRTHAGRNPLPGSVGDFSWSGVTGTYFWIDPKQELIAILLMQAPAQRMHYRYLMRTLVYQAITQ